MALVEAAQEAEETLALPRAVAVAAPSGEEQEAPLGVTLRGAEENGAGASATQPAEESGPVGDVARGLVEDVAPAVRPESEGETLRAGGLTMAGDEVDGLAGRGAAGSAAALYRRVNAGRLRSIAPESGRVTVRLEESPVRAGMGPREMDRVFQRDARRYDGGLGLL